MRRQKVRSSLPTRSISWGTTSHRRRWPAQAARAKMQQMSNVTAPISRVFRAFQVTRAGRPLIGAGDAMLGARVPIDIRPDAAGLVHPGQGGMSVTPDDAALLPPHFRPERLGGRGHLPVFEIATRDLGELLATRRDERKPSKHAFVEPSTTIASDRYQAALAATEAAWRVLA